jgi:hypothetical protein
VAAEPLGLLQRRGSARLRGMRRAFVPVSVLLLAFGACGSPPAVEVPVVPTATAVATTPPPPLPPAAWVELSRATSPGVAVPGGQVALVGGRRVWVASGRTELLDPTPVPLTQLLVVPKGSSSALVGGTEGGIYVFDDPRGPGRKVAEFPSIYRLDAVPGLLRVGVSSERSVWLGLDGALQANGPALPRLPLEPSSIAFADASRGVAHFPTVGNAYTTDGGATWRPIARYGLPSADARGLQMGGELLDVDSGELSELELPTDPLLRWLTQTQTNPLDAAVTNGLRLDNGNALIAGGDQLLEVDLATGLPTRATSLRDALGDDLPQGVWAVVRGPKAGTAFLVPAPNSYLPVLEVAFGSGAPTARLLGSQLVDGASVRTSASGGLAFDGVCEAESEMEGPPDRFPLCVRQPSGKLTTVWSTVSTEWAAPTAAGGLVALGPNDEEGSVGQMVFRTIDARGNVVRTDSLRAEPQTEFGNDLRLDEVAPGEVLTAGRWIDQGGGLIDRVVVRLRKGTVSSAKIPAGEFDPVAIGGGRVVVWTDEKMRVSADAGATWDESSAPSGDPSLRVTEVGAVSAGWARVGWGPAPAPPPPAAPPEPTVELPEPPKARRAVCEPGKPSPTSARLAETTDLEPTFATKLKKEALAQLDSRSDPHILPTEVRALLTVRVPKPGAPASAKAQLSFGWIDEHEVPARARLVEAALPSSVSLNASGRWSVDVLEVAASGERAVVQFTLGGRMYFVRASGSSIEVEQLDRWMFLRDIVIANDGAVAWVESGSVWLWPAKGKPQQLARASDAGRISVAPPTKYGVALLAGGAGWSSFRVLSIPKPGSPIPTLDVDGWARVPVGLGELGSSPTCAARPAKGAPEHLFVVPAGRVAVEVSGGSARDSTLWVRANASGACLQGFVARQSKDYSIVRADLGKGAYERAPRGEAVSKLTCKWP